jgi:hypothetical protein
MSNLRSRQAFADRAWDWEFLNDCFAPSRIRISDLDGIVERHGEFLIIEAKPAGQQIPKGQEILLDKLVARGFTVLVLYGEVNEPTAMQHWPAAPKPTTESAIQQFVREWWQWADGQKREAA